MQSWIAGALGSLVGGAVLIGFGWFAFIAQRRVHARGTLRDTPALRHAHRAFVASAAVTVVGIVLLLAYRSGGPSVLRQWGVRICVTGEVALLAATVVVLRERLRGARNDRVGEPDAP